MEKGEVTNEDLATLIKGEFNRVDERLGGMENRIENLEQSVKGLEQGQKNLEEGQEEIKLRLTNVAYRFEVKKLGERVTKLEKKVV
ncbi:MAG: hypothetical protein WCT39_04345 [Candidatus Margulisiibacteriota bacterium]